MAKVVFKAKTDNGVLRLPNRLRKNQIVVEDRDTRLKGYTNSEMLIDVVYAHLRAETRITLGVSKFLGDLPSCFSIKPGFLSEVTIDLGAV